MSWTLAVGYLGSALVATSLSMSNIWRLRWINLFGAATLATYGILIQAPPVYALNGFIVAVDVYHLLRLARRSDVFSFFEVPPSSPFLARLLAFHADDIARFFPDFDLARCGRPHVRLILRNMLPVGVFVCDDAGDGLARVELDYVVPGYRDLRNAHFVFADAHDALRERGFHTFVADSEVPVHQRYLRRLGFRPDPDRPTRFTRPV